MHFFIHWGEERPKKGSYIQETLYTVRGARIGVTGFGYLMVSFVIYRGGSVTNAAEAALRRASVEMGELTTVSGDISDTELYLNAKAYVSRGQTYAVSQKSPLWPTSGNSHIHTRRKSSVFCKLPLGLKKWKNGALFYPLRGVSRKCLRTVKSIYYSASIPSIFSTLTFHFSIPSIITLNFPVN